MRIRLFDPAANPRFDDLPWSIPLARWDHPRLVDLPAGLHRNVVRFVEYDGQFYALKELPLRLARREFRLLRTMNEGGLPVVAAVALVDRRGDDSAVLITRFLHDAVPFRHVFRERTDLDVVEVLIESMATLLARLHTAGFYWGDCSLSNALFRRDDAHLTGYALDTETGELHEQISDGQRSADLDGAIVNIAGGLADLAAAGELPDGLDPFEVAPRVGEAYTAIWNELHGESTYDAAAPADLTRRLARLHDLGFGVREAVITQSDEPGLFVFRPAEITDGHHRSELHRLTGILARENQARRLLEHIERHRAATEDRLGRIVPLELAAHQWLSEVFDPVIASVPPGAVSILERPQLLLDVLEVHGEAAAPTDDLLRTADRVIADVIARRRTVEAR
ncbi:MAG: DUF4032 domain-containing protein [Ilumatobacter sp.]|nr:DUF4032 domain-containing protein [Ilumatobacter sp.]